MKKIILFRVFILFLFLQVEGINIFANYFQQEPKAQSDSIIEDKQEEEAVINEIEKAKAPPSEDKVQYFSQVTKYGFKNLFNKYSYNPSMAYKAQINPNATSFVQDYMRKNQHDLIKMKSWGAPYFALMENILTRYGLPRELKYIAVIESNLNVHETSNVGAAGPWQFMPYTARDYGLVMNGSYDERRDYAKSTDAAARYLLNLYKQYHDWLLVMAAYNGGPGRVNSAIKRSGSRNFWDLQYYLPEESRTYVKRFIATHYIMEGAGGVTTVSNQNEGIENDNAGNAGNASYASNKTAGPAAPNYFDVKPNLSAEEKESTSIQTISGKYNSVVIAKNLAMDISRFNHFNPNFDNLIANGGSYDLRLPEDKMQQFMANKYGILNECVQVMLNDNSLSSTPVIYGAAKGNRKSNR